MPYPEGSLGSPLVLALLNQLTARWLFVLLAAAIATGLWQSARLAGSAYLAPYFLAVMIFAVASSLDLEALRRAAGRSGLWLRSFLFSYTAFPALAWAAGRLVSPDEPLLRLGLLLLALVPAANTASVYTALARGDVAVTLTGIALGNFLMPVVLLAFFAVQGQGLALSPATLWRTLIVFVIAPTAAGVALGTRLRTGEARGGFSDAAPGGPAALWRQSAPILARLCVMAILLLNAAALRAQMEIRIGQLLVLAVTVLLLESVMYGLTRWWAARRLPGRPAQAKAFCFLHATRNTALALTLAGTAFGAPATLPILVTFLVQEPLAAAVAAVFRTELPAPGRPSEERNE